MNSFPARLTLAVLFTVTTAISKTYTTRFEGTENPLSEGGAWLHAGLDWKPVRKVDGVAYGTQTGSGGYDDSYAHLSGFGPDQSAWGVIRRTPGSSGFHEVEIHLRWSDGAHSARGYECLLSYDGSYAQIVRWNGPFGDFTYIGSAAKAPVPKTGDTLRASITGNLIVVLYNGAEIMRATDNTYAAGDPGMGFFIQSNDDNSAMGFTSYTATDETASSGHTDRTENTGPFGLLHNYPNPFNPETTITYSLPFQSPVTLIVYDMIGREVAPLVDERQMRGSHSVRFDGSSLSGGMYAYRLTAGTYASPQRMVLLK
jgi:hypothetical protein